VEEKELQKLIFELQNGSLQKQRAASYKLSKSGIISSVPALIQAYENPDSSVRQNIVAGLRKINSPEAFNFLKSLSISSEIDSTESVGNICEKCGTRTQIGGFHTFIYGIKKIIKQEMINSTTTKTTSEYTLKESDPVYLCNKCIILQGEKDNANSSKITLIVVFVLFIISIPVSYFMNNVLFVLPMLALIFGGPMALFQYTKLNTNESIPQVEYADFNNNPLYKFSPGSSQAEANLKGIKNAGEIMAIQIKESALRASGMNVFFSHVQATEMKLLSVDNKDE